MFLSKCENSFRFNRKSVRKNILNRETNNPRPESRGLFVSLTQKSQNTQDLPDVFFHAELAEACRTQTWCRFASLRGTKQSRRMVLADSLDCFVVPPRNDAKRVGAKRQQIHIVQRILRAKSYSTTIFRVTPPNFTKYRPCGNSTVVFPSIMRVKMVCPKVFVTVIVPLPSMVKRSLAGFG